MFHRILFMILLIPLFFSFIHHNFILTIISMALAFIVAWMFIKFKNYSKKHYFIVVTLLLLCLNGLYLIITNDYSLESSLPFFGGLIIALIYINGWEKIVLINKSTSLIKEHKIEEALPYFNRILELDPKNFYALYNKALIYNETEKYEESLELSDKILKKTRKTFIH